MDKITHLSSKKTKLIQISYFISILIMLCISVFLIISYFEKDKSIITIQLIGYLFFILSSVFFLTRISIASLSKNTISYKKIFSEEKEFSVEDITKIKIILKKFVSIKYSKNNKSEILWISNTEKLVKPFDIYLIVISAKREFEKNKNEQLI